MATDWTRVRHFIPSEWRKDPTKVKSDLIYLVDDFREYLGRPVIIDAAWDDGGHVEGSAHYDGLAVDLRVTGLPLVEQWLAAERFPFLGIGLYPNWSTPGLHLDVRQNPEHPTVGRRWWRDQSGVYQALDRAFLKTIV